MINLIYNNKSRQKNNQKKKIDKKILNVKNILKQKLNIFGINKNNVGFRRQITLHALYKLQNSQLTEIRNHDECLI